MKKISLVTYLLLGCLLSCQLLIAQETFPYNGVADHRDGLYAFTNATIYKSHNQKLENATLVIKDGKVVSVGQGIAVPAGNSIPQSWMRVGRGPTGSGEHQGER